MGIIRKRHAKGLLDRARVAGHKRHTIQRLSDFLAGDFEVVYPVFTMATKFVTIDRNTPMLLPVDLRDWVEEDDLVHFILDVSLRVSAESASVNHRGCGS